MASRPTLRVLQGRHDLLTRPYRVAHSIPGRVRLQLDREDRERGAELAERLAAHPAVRAASWRSASRSLTVSFEDTQSFAKLLATTPDEAPARRRTEEAAQPLWTQFLIPAAALVAGFSPAGVLTRALIAICALPIARRAMRSLLRRHVSIDVLDAVAVSMMIATGDALAAGVSVFLIESGERIRRRASGRARRVLRGWMGADPHGVRVMRDGSEPRIPAAAVKIGDLVVVYASENVPVDGTVVGGAGSVDNRTWTGESLPKPVGLSSQVLAGSSLYDGRLVLEVTATGESTRAGKLAAALEDAIAADTRVSDMVYRVADRFVIPLFLVSGAVFGATRDLNRLISMLIVDFGSGFRVSIPTTILTTMISGARQDVLFKNGDAIEELARVDTIVFDKTGTLTTGHPVISSIKPEAGFTVDDVLRLAASAEGHLQHPIARAIHRAASRRGLALTAPHNVSYEIGGGVRAEVEGRAILLGAPQLLARDGIRVPAGAPAESSLVLLAVDGQLAGRIRLRDTIKESARDLVRDLRALGMKNLVLATGDHPAAAAAVSRQLGLDRTFSRLMPEDKIEVVRRLAEEGGVVAVVGDGINDAGAMAEASVGIAVPSGSELARETAEVVLLDEDLAALVTAIKLSRQAMGLIQQNIGLVAAPNLIGLTLASLGRLTPLTATVVNNGSTILAAGNALRPLWGRVRPARIRR